MPNRKIGRATTYAADAAVEWQRDWARTDQAVALAEVIAQHAGSSGIAFPWEQLLLNTPVPGKAA